MANETVQRTDICDLIRDLGHDPTKVSGVIIRPDEVVVEYRHQIVGTDKRRTKDSF